MLAVAGLFALLAPSAARADDLNYSFSGTLTPGGGTVSGTFTLDNSGAGSITQFDLTTPVLDFSSTSTSPTFTATVNALAAVSPADDFVDIGFEDSGDTDLLNLFFETTLSDFDATTPLYTASVEVSPGGYSSSGEQCGGVLGESSNCSNTGFGAYFTSGTATLEPAAAPEPSSALLLGAGLLGLAVLAGFSSRRLHA
jgi:hypothetical protein